MGFGVGGLGFGVWGLGFGPWGLGLRIWSRSEGFNLFECRRESAETVQANPKQGTCCACAFMESVIDRGLIVVSSGVSNVTTAGDMLQEGIKIW